MSGSPPIALAEAWERLLRDAAPLGEELLPIGNALGRHLAHPLWAKRTQPAADLSAMDGYAMGAQDLAGPWRVVGESAAGHPFPRTLSPGEAARISTGALMPDGAGAVLLQENARRDGPHLALNGKGDPTPRHIRRAGFDFREGDEVLPAGIRLGAPQIALAVAAGHGTLTVTRLPSLAVIDSGDELAADPADCPPHRIPASNGAMLAAMAATHAGEIRRIGPVADTGAALAAALAQADGADVIVTSGGVSVGDHDLVRPALEQWGAALEFWRVAIKPGKPLLLARRGRQWIIGLPGNPVSSYVTAFLFLLPLLRRLGGAADVLPAGFAAPLAAPLAAGGDRHEFIRARLAQGKVAPLGEQDSSALAALGRANALIDRPPGAPALTENALVRVYPLENGGNA